MKLARRQIEQHDLAAVDVNPRQDVEQAQQDPA